VVLVFLAGVSLGVRLDATQWLELGGLLLAGLTPFIALGIVLGYLLSVDALTPAIGGVVVLFALVGGVYGFQLAHSGPLFDVMKAIPSYWLVQAGKTAFGGGSWPAQGWIVIAAWTAVLVGAATLAYRRSAARG
jgi:ABC-2 type transport system permease protein